MIAVQQNRRTCKQKTPTETLKDIVVGFIHLMNFGFIFKSRHVGCQKMGFTGTQQSQLAPVHP